MLLSFDFVEPIWILSNLPLFLCSTNQNMEFNLLILMFFSINVQFHIWVLVDVRFCWEWNIWFVVAVVVVEHKSWLTSSLAETKKKTMTEFFSQRNRPCCWKHYRNEMEWKKTVTKNLLQHISLRNADQMTDTELILSLSLNQFRIKNKNSLKPWISFYYLFWFIYFQKHTIFSIDSKA